MPEEFNAMWLGLEGWDVQDGFTMLWFRNTPDEGELNDMDAIAMWCGMSV